MNIIIKNKETVIELQKNQILEVLETSDGIAFNLRNGLSLIFIDNFMPSTAKQLIKGTIDQCTAEQATITVDLANRLVPASLVSNFVTPASPPVK